MASNYRPRPRRLSLHMPHIDIPHIDIPTPREMLVQMQKQIKPPDQTAQKHWIRRNILSCKGCRRFSINERNNLCFCGRVKAEHSQEAISNGESDPKTPWTNAIDGQDQHTLGYGKIRFVSEDTDQTPNFVRISGEMLITDDGKKKVKELMQEVRLWDLGEEKRPNLLISVTGGADDFKGSSSSSLRTNFVRGLCEAAKSVNAWIITGGINRGVIKLIGDDLQGEVTTIGVVPWGIVKDKEILLRKSDKDTRKQHALFDYEPHDSEMEGAAALNPHHTHFFLVDNGVGHAFGGRGVTDLLTNFELEKCIAHMYQKSIPTILMIVNGGHDTAIELVTKYKDTPCVVVQGSGGTADIIANAHAISESRDGLRSLSTHARWNVVADISRHFPHLEEKKREGILRAVKEVIRRDNLLTIYSLTSKEHDLDHAILYTLIKSKTETYSAKEKMTMAIMWNRLELAEQILQGKTGGMIDKEFEFDSEDGFTLMELAIQFNREQFIPLILEKTKDFEMKDFLTYEKLTDYYNYRYDKYKPDEPACFRKKHFFKLIKKVLPKLRRFRQRHEDIELEDIGYVLSYILGGGFKNPFSDDEPSIDSPFDMLLIYCVLNGMDKMADLLWRYTHSPITTALICTRIYRYFAKNTGYLQACDTDAKKQYLAEATKYEHYACKSLTQCPGRFNKQDTYLLLGTKHRFWGHSIIDMAYMLWSEEMLAHGVVQNYLSKVWMGEIKCNIVFKEWMIIPIPFLLHYKQRKKCKSKTFISYYKHEHGSPERIHSEKQLDIENNHKKPKKSQEKKTSHPLTWYQKVGACYTAPVVKCTLHYMCFLVFLSFYIKSLIETNDKKCAVSQHNSVEFVDILLFSYVVGTLPTEINQIIQNPASKLPAKMWHHFSSFYNLMDSLAIPTYIASFVIRFTTPPILQQESLQNTSCQYVLPYVNTYYNESLDAYNIAHYLTVMAFIFYALKMMMSFKNNAELGPKVVMVFAMFKDLWFFIILLFLFIVIYAVGTQAIVLPNRRSHSLFNSPTYFFHLTFYRPYLLAIGEFDTDKYIEEFSIDHCKKSDVEDSLRGCGKDGDWNDLLSENYIASVDYYGFIALTICYILTVNILLVNLLIAIFSNTYARLQQHSKKLYLSERAQLILEFKEGTVLPNPFSILEYIWWFCKWITCKRSQCYGSKKWRNLKMMDYLLDYNRMTKIERACCEGFLLIRDEEQDDYVKDQLKEVRQNLTKVKDRLDNTSLGAVKTDEVQQKPASLPHYLAVSENPIAIHIDSRNSPYPKTQITRTMVPDHRVPWQVRWKDYAPVEYTKIRQLGTGKESTYDRKTLSQEMIASFNRFEHGINRRSFHGEYSLDEHGRPINPRGRTGMSGKGNLKRWGVNHQGDVVVTRYLRDSHGDYVEHPANGRRILEFVAVRKHKQWALPGGRADEGEMMGEVLGREFCEEALGSLDMGEEKRKEAMIMVGKHFGLGINVYQGYVDDPSNTDNAWFETTAVNYHDSDGSSFSQFKLSGENTPEEQIDAEKGRVAKWITLDQDIDLYANHEEIMEKVCFHRTAYCPLKDVATLIEVDSGGRVLKKKQSPRWGIIVREAEQ